MDGTYISGCACGSTESPRSRTCNHFATREGVLLECLGSFVIMTFFDLKWHHSKKPAIAVQFTILGLIALQLCMCQAGKVIVVTTPLGVSHIVNLRKIAEELAQQRGHQITVSSPWLSLILSMIEWHHQC